MNNQILVEYITKSLAQGYTEDLIRQSLLSNGWAAPDVDQAFSFVRLTNQTPKPDGVPAPASPSVNQTFKPKKPNINSTYSAFLAVALFVFLIIMVNKIYSDLNSTFLFFSITGNYITGRLVADALMAIPLLAAAAILHYTLALKSDKFKILSQTYYLASGWPILRLLGNISRYLFDSGSAYGVYFALILLVLVLTGIIFFVQKYFRKS